MTDTTRINRRAEDLVVQLVADGVFTIDPSGRIWREATVQYGTRKPCAPVLADEPCDGGYRRVRVMVGGVRLRVRSHRVVYRCCVGPIPDGYVVDHVNTIRDDNRPENLEAVTHAENMRRMRARRGRRRRSA